jgi:ribosomal protein S18 acetylase RimI-like enzyme
LWGTQLPEEREIDLRLRPFVEGDEAAVNSWFSDAGELRAFSGPRLTWPLDEDQWRSIRLDPTVTAWTALEGDSDTPIGHGELVAESETTVRLARFGVAPHSRGRGVGLAIVRMLIEKSRERGYQLVVVNVHRDNSTAIRAYRGLGFTAVDAPLAHSNVRMEMALA